MGVVLKRRIKKIKTMCCIVFLLTIIFSFMEVPQAVKAATGTVAVPTSVKAVSYSYNSTYISWSSVAGAGGYAIYRAESSTGNYALISMTTVQGYRDTALTTGKTYYYKIRAYRVSGKTRVYGNYSSKASVKPIPSAPTLVKAAASSYNSTTISWGGVAGANGYQVYQATSSTGTYKLIAATAAKVYRTTGLKMGTTYYYKVRAYRNIDGKKVYSSFSTVKKGTISVVKVTSVTLNKSVDTLVIGTSKTLTVSIAPANATNQSVTWESSDDTVATVDDEGNVTAVGVGTATITVTTVDGSKTAACIITVNSDVNNVQINGIDVSRHQQKINWASVKKAGVQFAMIRSSFGDGTSGYKDNGIDTMFETNYTEAKANGIAVGAYHYSYAKTIDEAETEVDFFISRLQGKQFEYPVCVDIEDASQSSLSKKKLTDIALVYLQRLNEAGYYPMIYANKNWFTTKLDDSKLTTYEHWLAQYNSSITYTGTVGIWQYTSSGIINGINGKADMDISYVDYAAKIKSLHLNGF
ncbi:GH25 family lysozyme [Clostridium oryzae]|uniref:Lysozyme M1 n=1 Tax=Clostridium oryzae TaxID=1450648 RepID=A0A1V4IJZ5_9CLOT|nr:GH25 family lysozyme [Clostridium oryzae]OPJ60223.1 lysozyme M1 precursor [Clostridium oryzae]